jgi:hypothetical protein
MLTVLRDLTGQYMSEQQRKVTNNCNFLLFLLCNFVFLPCFLFMNLPYRMLAFYLWFLLNWKYGNEVENGDFNGGYQLSCHCYFGFQFQLFKIMRICCFIIASDVIPFPLYAQEVLAQVLEEAGYTKDSFLVLSDFMKVPKPKQLISSMTCCTGILRFHLGKHFNRGVAD